ncbi:sporulation protein [Balneatrix alpica]|uniref:Sporulation protein n=1 Tax=Balneatrix alpica TaxID=75684 RepID=A0ABV5ZHX8_9GAMM|nr:sporulation protein [Balneatrix alpica]
MLLHQRLLSSIGYGCARIDTQLSRNRVRAGQRLAVDIYLHGGGHTELIPNLELILLSHSGQTIDSQRLELWRYPLLTALSLEAQACTHIQAHCPIPLGCPVSLQRQTLWVQTNLDQQQGFTLGEENVLAVLPGQAVERLLDLLRSQQWQLHSSGCLPLPEALTSEAAYGQLVSISTRQGNQGFWLWQENEQGLQLWPMLQLQPQWHQGLLLRTEQSNQDWLCQLSDRLDA